MKNSGITIQTGAPKPLVVVIGSVTIDEIHENGLTALRLGGVVTYGGITFQRHGVGTAIVTNHAREDSRILNPLAGEGITIFSGTSASTTRFVNRSEGDRRGQEMPRAADPIGAAQIGAAPETILHFPLGPLHPEDIGRDAIERVAASKCLVSLDVQGYLRGRSNGRIVPAVSPGLEAVLRASHIVKADDSELELMLRAFRMSLPGFLEHFRITEAVITRGSRGASVWTLGGEGYQFGAERVDTPVSTVGAGDVFFAAYLANRIHRRTDIEQSASRATQTAARQVRGEYIRPGLLSLGTGRAWKLDASRRKGRTPP